MAWSSKIYGKVFGIAFSATGVNLQTGDVTALLTSSSYTPDQDVHDYLDDVTNELSGGGYARVDLTGETVSYDAATNKMSFTGSAFSFSGITGTARHCVIFVDTGTPATSPLVMVISSDVDISLAGNALTFTPQAGGLFEVTVS